MKIIFIFFNLYLKQTHQIEYKHIYLCIILQELYLKLEYFGSYIDHNDGKMI